jgi:aspartyl-tRNA(Asn)/glutamyl-tRNA(Gln) amidotransferase subunit A
VAAILARSRGEPFAASPDRGPEPADAEAFLARSLDERLSAPDADVVATDAAVGSLVDPAALHLAGVGELLAAYAAGGTTPVEVVTALLARCGPDGPAPDAVLGLIPGAGYAAVDSAARWRAGTARPLEGIPFGVKDIVDVAGVPVTAGSQLTGDRVGPADATVVARLKAAGAIPIVMLATTEFACGSPEPPRYGRVANPWDRTRWTGGSSTGPAAALAARLVPLALGTDTGGSIRLPASWCGISGLKPTRGLVPRTGVASLSWTLDHVGPMARSAADLALVLPVLAGPDGLDPLAAAAVPSLRAGRSIAGLQVGVAGGWFTDGAQPAVLAALAATTETLRSAGATVTEVDLGDLALVHQEAYHVLYSELAASQEAHGDRLDEYDQGTADRIGRGRTVGAVDYIRALRRRSAVQLQLAEAMVDVDVVLTPGTPTVAVGFAAAQSATLGASASDPADWTGGHARHSRTTMIFDVTGFPALVVPAGFDGDGLPIGVQIAARPFDDALCLAVGIALQNRTTHHLPIPPGC